MWITQMKTKTKKTKPKKKATNPKEELQDLLGNQIALKALHDSEGGEILIDSLIKDIFDAIDILCTQDSLKDHTVMIVLACKIKERMDILKSLTGAKSQVEVYQDLLSEVLKKEKENEPEPMPDENKG